MTSTNKTATVPADIALAGVERRISDVAYDLRSAADRSYHDRMDFSAVRGHVRELSDLLDLVESLDGVDDDQ